jgi:hypothetical protein
VLAEQISERTEGAGITGLTLWTTSFHNLCLSLFGSQMIKLTTEIPVILKIQNGGKVKIRKYSSI